MSHTATSHARSSSRLESAARGTLAGPRAHAEVPVDLQRTDRDVVVTMPLGGVAHGSTKVSCSGRVLNVVVGRGAHEHGASKPSGRLKVEVLRHTIELPCDVDAKGAHASYAHGLLTIRLPLVAT